MVRDLGSSLRRRCATIVRREFAQGDVDRVQDALGHVAKPIGRAAGEGSQDRDGWPRSSIGQLDWPLTAACDGARARLGALGRARQGGSPGDAWRDARIALAGLRGYRAVVGAQGHIAALTVRLPSDHRDDRVTSPGSVGRAVTIRSGGTPGLVGAGRLAVDHQLDRGQRERHGPRQGEELRVHGELRGA